MLSSEHLQQLASEAGLDLVGAMPVGPSPAWHAYQAWVAQGYAGEMAYLTRPEALHRRQDPRNLMPEARSVMVVGASYAGAPAPPLPALTGRVSRYAWRGDYHDWVLARLKLLVESVGRALSRPLASRCYVDTGPILERAWATAAGLGWLGKNTSLISPRMGSFLFLGVALLDVDLPCAPVPERALPSCGSCTRCLDACPTGALVRPGVLDARRCLSYLTIEHRGAIPEALRASLGDRVFGCDTCQDVCPWNGRPLAAHQGEAAPAVASLGLPDLLTLDATAFRARFRALPIWRATPVGLARNAAVVLGNLGDPAARPYLVEAAAHHPDGMVRDHARWALERLP